MIYRKVPKFFWPTFPLYQKGKKKESLSKPPGHLPPCSRERPSMARAANAAPLGGSSAPWRAVSVTLENRIEPPQNYFHYARSEEVRILFAIWWSQICSILRTITHNEKENSRKRALNSVRIFISGHIYFLIGLGEFQSQLRLSLHSCLKQLFFSLKRTIKRSY